jgi:hypothetical protein
MRFSPGRDPKDLTELAGHRGTETEKLEIRNSKFEVFGWNSVRFLIRICAATIENVVFSRRFFGTGWTGFREGTSCKSCSSCLNPLLVAASPRWENVRLNKNRSEKVSAVSGFRDDSNLNLDLRYSALSNFGFRISNLNSTL